MNWKQIKDITLQKMFATQGGNPIQDDAAKDYIYAMPAAANEALAMLCARKFGEVKRLEFAAKSGEVKNLADLAPDYLCSASALREVNGGECDYKIFGTNVFVAKSGCFEIFYYCAPQIISALTQDAQEIKINAQAVAILPLYIASELYKDDDAGIAAGYRNEYEAAVEMLELNIDHMGEGFEQTAGWCV